MGLFNWHWPAENESGDLISISETVNLTASNVKVDVPEGEEELLIKGVYLWEEDGKVRGLKGEEIIFEITKRSKSFKELEPYFRHKAKYVTIKAQQGDYGLYYRVRLKFDVIREQ